MTICKSSLEKGSIQFLCPIFLLIRLFEIFFFFSYMSFLGMFPMAQWQIIGLQCRRRTRHGFDLWVGKIPWRRKRQPTPVLLPGKSHGRKSMMGYSPQRCSVRENLATEHTATSILYILDVITSSAYNRKYFLPFYRLPVYFIYSFLCCAKLLVWCWPTSLFLLLLGLSFWYRI